MNKYRIVECMQGSDEWYQARLGKITGSVFDKIVTPTGKLSASHEQIINKAVAELIMGETEDTYQSDAMLRGQSLEHDALKFFNFTKGYEFTKVGFLQGTNEDGEDEGWGISPDGYDDKKGLELKCPLAHTHLAYLSGEKLPKEYLQQVQGALWATGKEIWVFGSYHPDFPCFSIEVEPDLKLHKAFDEHIPYCCELIQAKFQKLKEMMK